ncbi:uncharacterized protein LOC128093743 [Culex pipiens pallens]|uniref:uncharacterized protein LOC128093743 n=1 Tax=Culex pipiens pallens TaxID=42434 RepID=UPI0022AA9636|nr:uncharacterized protein LOC128093743 [Culex pipiens pallens]
MLALSSLNQLILVLQFGHLTNQSLHFADLKGLQIVDLKGLEFMETVPAIQFSKTQRGRIMLIYEGYKYVENRQSNKNVFWRCSKYVKFGCRATCVTSKNPNDFPIRLAGSAHSHGPEKIYPSDKVIVPTDQEIQALTNLRPGRSSNQ